MSTKIDMKVGEAVECYEDTYGSKKVVWYGVVAGETRTLFYVQPGGGGGGGGRAIAFMKSNGAERPKYVMPRYIRRRAS